MDWKYWNLKYVMVVLQQFENMEYSYLSRLYVIFMYDFFVIVYVLLVLINKLKEKGYFFGVLEDIMVFVYE